MSARYGHLYVELGSDAKAPFIGMDTIKVSDDWYNAFAIALDWAVKASKKNPTRLYGVIDSQYPRNANRSATVIGGVVTKYDRVLPLEAVQIGEPVKVEWWSCDRIERTLLQSSTVWGLQPRADGSYKMLARNVQYIKVIAADGSIKQLAPHSGVLYEHDEEASWDEYHAKNRAYDEESVISVEDSRRVKVYTTTPNRKQEDWDEWVRHSALWNACMYQTVTGKQAPLAGNATPFSFKAGDEVTVTNVHVFTKENHRTYEVASVWLDGRVQLHDGSIVPYFTLRKVEKND